MRARALAALSSLRESSFIRCFLDFKTEKFRPTINKDGQNNIT